MPGSGTMTPIGTGAGIGLSLAQPLPYTLLSLQRYARIMGISPLHFARGATPGLTPTVFPDTGCDDIWFKYDWQDHDKVSWLQLAHVIQDAENEIANLVGFWPAPTWMASEMHPYPRPYRREYYGTGLAIRYNVKSVKADFGKFINPGRRAVTLIGTPTVAGGSLTYTDEDGDGFFETATVTIATVLTNANEIKVYQAGKSGDMDWEIRNPRKRYISGGNYVAIFDSWLFIDPDLYEDYPVDGGLDAIDVTTVANFVASVDVYREYTDTTQVSAQFRWELSCTICGGTGCAACGDNTQNGCLHPRIDNPGLVVPTPATYDAALAQWTQAEWTNGYEPDAVRLWYYAGDVDREYERGATVDPLSNWWALIIAHLATARLERPICGCANIQNLANDLQIDLTFSDRTASYFNGKDVMNCPFGTKKGEVIAWRRIRHLKSKILSGGML